MEKKRFGVISLSVLMLLLLSVSSCGSGAGDYNSTAEAQFREMIGVRVPKRILVYTSKKRYTREEGIGLWVENRTGQTLWFVDQSLGIEAYQYDQDTGQWRSVDLGFTVGAPETTAIKPGGPLVSSNYTIYADMVKGSGKIRLVITGFMEDGQAFAAYTDIEIVEP